MLQRIFSGILAVCILIGICTVSAFAENDYKYSKIVYYKDGSEVTGLTAGDITAKIKIKSETKTNELFFAMLLYRNNKLIAASVDETPAAVASIAVTYEAVMTIPSDLAGLELVTVLWEGKTEMKAVCAASIVPSDESSLMAIKIDGADISGFEPDTYEYDVALTDEQVANASAPWIDCIAYDSGAKVEITHPTEFPGTAKIKVTASDGETTAEYTVNYKYDKDIMALSNASVIRNGSNDTGNESKVVLHENLTSGIENFGVPQNIPATYVDPDLEGAYYVTVITGTRETSFDLTLKRPSKVHAIMSNGDGGNAVATDAFSDWTLDSTGWDKTIENNWNKIEDDDGTYTHTDGKVYKYAPVGQSDGEIVEWPEDLTSETDRLGSAYDVKNQGWVYIDWNVSSGQNREHHMCAFTHKFTKSAAGGETVSITEKCGDAGLLVVIQPEDWSEPINPHPDLEF